MKYVFLFFSLISPILSMADHGEHAHLLEDGYEISTPVLQVGTFDPEGELIALKVNGLVCDFCAQSIEKVFMRKPEVSGINVNLNDGEIMISSKAKQIIEDAELEKLLLDAGYNLVQISRSQGGH